jgi:hypothetical protein
VRLLPLAYCGNVKTVLERPEFAFVSWLLWRWDTGFDVSVSVKEATAGVRGK